MTTPNATLPAPDAVTTPPAAPVAPVIDNNTIAAAVQAGIAAHTQQTQSAPKPMTPEEQNAYLQIFDPNEDGFVDSFISAVTDPEATPEQKLKVISHFRDGVANQSIRGAQLLVEQQITALRQEFAPIVSTVQEQRVEKLWSDFATKHPDLKDQRALVDTVSVQLQQSGFAPKSLDEAFSRAAETTRQLIAQATGKPYVAPTANPTGANPKPQMTQTNVSQPGPTPAQAPTDSGVASFFLKRNR